MAGGLSTSANIGQIILKPMGGTETFYMDDMYFSGSGIGTGTDTGLDTGTDSGSDTDATPVELLADGGFGDGTGWSGNALNIVDGVTHANVATMGNPWDVNLSGAVALTSGDDYTLVFEARGAEGRALKAGIGDAGPPYHNDVADLTLTDGWQMYTLHVTALDATHGGDFTGASRVVFDMGHDVGEVDIDNVSLIAGHVGTENLTGSPVTDPTDQVTDTDTDAVDGNGDAIHLSAAHAIMSVEEAANAFEVSADTGEDWTVTLTGSNYAAALAARGEAETSLVGLSAQLVPLAAIAGLEQLGLDELNAALGIAEAAEAGKQAERVGAETDYNTAYGEARTAFVAATADPDTLMTAGDVVLTPITSPSVTIDTGATWTQSQINSLRADMDSFISAFTWPDAQGQTVDQLEGDLSDAVAQLGSAQQQVADATLDRDTQQGVVDVAVGAVVSKEGEIAATEVELQEAQALVDASRVVKSGTGTGSAQVVSLDPGDLTSLGDGQVAVELLTESSSVSASFELDTTADGDETALAVSVDTVISNPESDNVTLTLTGVDSDAAIVTVTLTGADGGQVTANAEAGNNGDWIADVSGGTLADGYVAVSVNVTDNAGNTASTSTGFDLDTTADELDDLSVTVGDIIRESGAELVTLTLSGVDGDVDAATGVVVTLTDNDNNVVTASYDANSDNWVADLTGLYGHQVTVSSTVEDSAGNQSTVSTVTAINRAPEFASTTVDVSFDEGLGSDEIVYQASATDVNGDGLAYSLSGPDAQLMEIDNLTGMIRFRQSPDYESGKTVYEVTVVASDGELAATQDVTVTVNDVNEAPDFDHDRVFLQSRTRTSTRPR